MRLGQTEAVICILVLCKRQVWENSVARERDRLQFSKNDKILENFEKIDQNRCLQRKIEHLAWARCSTSWSMSLREFKTFMNFGGPAGCPRVMSDITWLVETRYFSLGEQYYSTAGANWTRMAKELFVISWYRNGQCSRSNGRISMRLCQTEAVICIFGSWKYQVWENSVARERDRIRF